MTKTIHHYVCYLLLILLLLYNFMYAANRESGSLLLQGSIVLVLLISIVYFFKTLVHKAENRLFFRAWTFFLLLNVFGFIFTADYSNRYDYGMFLGVLVTFLTFYPFYYFSQQGILTSKKLIWFFIILIPIAIYGFYTNQADILASRKIANPNITNKNVVNNMSYYFVRLMPFVFLIKNHRVLATITMAILMIFIIMGSKRGALIAGGLTLIMYFYYLWKTQEKKGKLQGYILSFSGIAVLSLLGYRYFTQNQFLIERMADISGGSGRDRIFSIIFNNWFTNQNFDNFLFGYGFGASRDITGGNFAHNDWLEIVSNFGLFGGIIYLILIVAGFKIVLKKDLKFDKRILVMTLMVTWLWITMISMWYNNIQGYTNSILLAYLIGSQSNSLE